MSQTSKNPRSVNAFMKEKGYETYDFVKNPTSGKVFANFDNADTNQREKKYPCGKKLQAAFLNGQIKSVDQIVVKDCSKDGNPFTPIFMLRSTDNTLLSGSAK